MGDEQKIISLLQEFNDIYNLVHSLEKDIITMSIKKYGSVNKAAAMLGLSQPALWKKCRALNIENS